MAKKEIIWTKKSEIQLFSILYYYADRNKSDEYSIKLKRAIDSKLTKIDFSVSLPRKATKENIFFLIHNHIAVFFILKSNKIYIVLVWDERRNPADLTDTLHNL